MINQQLVEYITHQLQVGISREVIKNALFESGWTEADIAEAMNRTAQGPRLSVPGAAIARDVVFQPKDEPVFQQKQSPAAASSAPQTQTNAGGMDSFHQSSGSRGVSSAVARMSSIRGTSAAYKKFLLPVGGGVVFVGALVAAALFYFQKTDVEFELAAAKGARESLANQIAQENQVRANLEERLEALSDAKRTLEMELSLFTVPAGSTSTGTDVPFVVRGAVSGGGGSSFTVTTASGIALTVKNSKDAKAAAALTPLAGSIAEISGTHAVGSRDITVTAVNGKFLE